ncbi:MAG: radical SAM protein [Candidatus Aminicenantes bacterium]|nr:radical SAM protein [Candidatus Aminicenantes bacterium]
MKKKRVAFRIFSGNRLTLPLLLNVWEKNGLDHHFDIFFAAAEPGCLSAAQSAALRASDVCVFSFMTPHLPLFAAEIRSLRVAGKSAPRLAAGGPHVSGDRELARACGFDILFSGAGEDSFLRFAHDLLGEKITAKGDPLFYEAPTNAADASPVGDLSWERYIPASRYFKTVPPLEISRGCFWSCRYCQTGGSRPRYRGQDSIGSYLEELRRRGFSRAGFIAPSALEFAACRRQRPELGRIEQLLELCRLAGFKFIEFGIFPSEIRPDTVSAEGLGLLRRYVANRRLTFGAQSAVNARLDSIGRGHTSAQIVSAVAAANAAGFAVNLDFIIALPGETAAERRELLEFISAIRKKYRVHIQLHHFFPLAGSAFAWRLPSFLSADERQVFSALKKNGLASDWWQAGERAARAYLAWLASDFPVFFAQFT